ncbi:MAG: glycosyltransferase family 4 protein, partial [Chloroflexota bacterium]|nr:glycosyltransferase family 4 protein [Chloroflexota bacterium]
MSTLRVLILTHHYPPEVGAPQTRLSGTAAFLRSRGHDVRVVTALPSYPTGVIPAAYRGRRLVREWIDGIPVVRTWTWARPGGSIRLRLANQLSFAASAPLALPWVGRRDVILVESPPLLVGLSGALFGAMLRAPLVLHVSDLWPAVAIQLGALRNPLVIRAAELFERAVYRMSRRVIVVTERWATQLVARGVPADKIDLVTNGVDAAFFDPGRAWAGREQVRRELGVADDATLVACIGTVSNVYGYDVMLDAARRLAARGDLRVLIVGDGSLKRTVEGEVQRSGLHNVALLPAQPHARVRDLYAAADVSVGALLPLPVTRGQLPVRVLEAMAMARPIAFAGEGVAATLVESSGAGLVAPPNDGGALAELIARLADDRGLRERLGGAGRRLVEERYSRAKVAAG